MLRVEDAQIESESKDKCSVTSEFNPDEKFGNETIRQDPNVIDTQENDSADSDSDDAFERDMKAECEAFGLNENDSDDEY